MCWLCAGFIKLIKPMAIASHNKKNIASTPQKTNGPGIYDTNNIPFGNPKCT